MKQVVLELPPTPVVNIDDVCISKIYLVKVYKEGDNLQSYAYIQCRQYGSDDWCLKGLHAFTEHNSWSSRTKNNLSLNDYIKYLISLDMTVYEFENWKQFATFTATL